MKRENSLQEMELRMAKSHAWAVPYADFISNMMVLFLMLFSFLLEKNQGGRPLIQESLGKMEEQFGGSISKERLNRLTRQKEESDLVQNLEKGMKEQGMADMAQVQVDAKYIKLVLKAPVLFASGSAELKPEAANLLQGIADQLKKTSAEIIVAGHSDNVPIKSGKYLSNLELSMGRAYSVVLEFQRQGVPAQRLTCTGYGEYRPVGNNLTSAGRAANRRIEISLLREE
ncbi:MAG: OmpA family protein [Elusimicrobiales bacterium]